MSRNKTFAWIAFAALLLFGAALSMAQSFYGSVVGTVTDPTGKSIASVQVALTNVGTAERRTTRTDANGSYQFLNLLPSVYKVDIEETGFKHLMRDQIQVRVDNATRVDATLELGAVAETVTVVSETALVQTESATLSQVVEGRQVQDMPLSGRNVLNLIALTPGVVAGGGSAGFPLNNVGGGTGTSQAGFGNYQIGGGISSQNAMFIDGAQNNLSGNNTPVVPTQDAIQEFGVLANSISAEYGGFGGGVVNMTTKSGTNAFHGTAYEYLRNKVLNANTFFNNKRGISRPPFTQNQYGGTVGGPVIHNKTFFFGSWEGFAVRQGVSSTYTVPTAAFRAGNFAGQNIIYDPLTTCGQNGNATCGLNASGQSIITRQAFLNNQIPANRLDPTILAMLKYWALPNAPGIVNNYIANVATGGNSNQVNVRVDHTINDKQRVFARYTWWKIGNVKSDPFNSNTGGMLFHNTNNQIILGYTNVIQPTLILDLRAAYTRQNTPQQAESFPSSLSQFGPAWAALEQQVTFPSLLSENISGGFYPYNGNVSDSRDNDYYYSGNLTKVVGRHTIKFGGSYKRDLAENQTGSASGNFTYDATFTSANATNSATSGLGFADFLLGYPTSGSMTTTGRVYTYINTYGFYVTDTYQVHPRLTLTLGLRWEQPGADGELNNNNLVLNLNQLDPIGPAAGLPNLVGQPVLVASPNHPNRLDQDLHWKDFSPRVGVAWRLNNSTVIRSGFGMNYLPYLVGAYGPTRVAINSATTNMVTTLNGGLTPNAVISNPFPNGLIQPAGRATGFLQKLEGGNIYGVLPDQPAKYMMQWNFSIQKQFAHDMLLQVGYAANVGKHLAVVTGGGGGVNLNQIPDTAVAQYGAALLDQVPNPFFGVLPTSVGLLGQRTVPRGQLLRPFPQFINVQALTLNQGNSNYQSLQVTFQKRFSGAGTIMANYTWSKFLSDTESATGNLEGVLPGWTQDWSNRRADWSLESTNIPRRLVVSYIYDLPFGQGRRYLSGLHGAMNQIVGGWSVNGVSTFADGYPLVMTSLANALSSQFGASWNTNGFNNQMRPNVVGGCNPAIDGSAVSRLTQWFNTACYTVPGNTSFGNASRTDPRLQQQGTLNFDASVIKNFVVREGWNLEFHTEFFNLANRTQFAAPNTQAGNPAFGTVTSTAPSWNPRLIQFALRLKF